VADPAREQADEHLSGARPGELDLLHGQGRPEFLQYRRSDVHHRKSTDRKKSSRFAFEIA
jgi:hypothetical protein